MSVEGIGLRDAGISKVLESQTGEWKEKAREYARLFVETRERGSYFIGEDIRMFTEKKAGSPTHCNAWGGLIQGVIRYYLKQECIVIEGWGQAAQKSAHARLYPRYKVVGAPEGVSK